MKVAVVVNGFPSVSETFIAIQLNELVKLGADVTIFNIGHIGEQSWLPRGCSKLIKQARIVNLKYEVANKNALLKLGAVFMNSPLAAIKICLNSGGEMGRMHALNEAYFLTQMLQSQIVHFQFLTHADHYLRYFKLGISSGNSKIVSSVRGFDITKRPFCDSLDWKLLLNKCSSFLPVCDFLGRKITERDQSAKYTCIPSPINQSYKAAVLTEPRFDRPLKIISVGRLVEKKGLHIALKALALCKQKGLDFHYTIIGQGELTDELKALTAQLNLQEQVEFTGALPSKNTIEKMLQNDVLLVPSVTASDGDCEGIPNVIKEGIMLKKLVIASTHAGITEILTDGNTGFLFEEGVEAELCDTIFRALDKESSWSQMIDSAHRTVLPKYVPKATAQSLVQVYEQLI